MLYILIVPCLVLHFTRFLCVCHCVCGFGVFFVFLLVFLLVFWLLFVWMFLVLVGLLFSCYY